MSFQNTATSFSSNRDEKPFSTEELSVSRTDNRGAIVAGNETFRRTSDYSWDEIIGAPYKIMRHADMPKGIFYILWEQIQQGLTTGIYIKNISKDGRCYWVYALISPVEGGYVSIGIKPTSKGFSQAQAVYAEILKREKSEDMTPKESAEKMYELLRGLGFPNYSAFSSHATAQELESRDSTLGRGDDGCLRSLNNLLPKLRELDEEQHRLYAAFSKIRGIPSNMRIVASRLEPAGGPISAISQNYRLMSDDATNHLGAFQVAKGKQSVAASALSRIYKSIGTIACARLQGEVATVASDALMNGEEGQYFTRESEALVPLLDNSPSEADAMLVSVLNDVISLAQSAKDLRQLVTGLDSIRVLCRVEAGRLGANSASLVPVINQLDKFHVEIDSTLERILNLSERIKGLLVASMPRTFNGSLQCRHS